MKGAVDRVSAQPFKETPLGMIVVLTVTAVVVGGVLAGFFQLVEGRIEANRLAEEKRAIFAVLPGIESYDTVEVDVTIGGETETLNVFRGRDAVGTLKGYAFKAEHPGYAAVISMVVGLNVDHETLTGLKVTEQIETPGLGDKIAKEPFEGQFRGLSVKPEIIYIKNRKPTKPNEIQAISGATISSRAVTTAINKTVAAVLDVLAEVDAVPAPALPPPPGEPEGEGTVPSAEGDEPEAGVKREGAAEVSPETSAEAPKVEPTVEDGDRKAEERAENKVEKKEVKKEEKGAAIE